MQPYGNLTITSTAVVQPKPPKPLAHGKDDPPIGEISLVDLKPGRVCMSCKRKTAVSSIVYWWNAVSKAEYCFCESPWCHGVASNHVTYISKQPAPTKKVRPAEQPKPSPARPAWLLPD